MINLIPKKVLKEKDFEIKKYEEMKKRLDELTILYEMNKISTSSPSLDQVLKEMAKSLQHFFKFES